MLITINGVSVTQSLSVQMKAINKDAQAMVPNNASPVLKTKIVFTIQDNFPYNLNASEFTVNMTLKELSSSVSPYYSQGQNTQLRRLNVVNAF